MDAEIGDMGGGERKKSFGWVMLVLVSVFVLMPVSMSMSTSYWLRMPSVPAAMVSS